MSEFTGAAHAVVLTPDGWHPALPIHYMLSHSQLSAALDNISESLSQAGRRLEESYLSNDEFTQDVGEWQLGLAYIELLVLTESLSLPSLRSDIASLYSEAQKDIGAMEPDSYGEYYSKWAPPARRFMRAIQNTLAIEPAQTVTKDLESILRAATYSITDSTVFPAAPNSESELHRRVEAVLRCVFPDLVTKPRLGKPIKNFEPDTGLPSLETLIEYKYIAHKSQVASIADEILADTRGYTSKEWKSFVFAVYETERFRPEGEWRQLLRHSGVPESTTIIVMSGEPQRARTRARRTSTPRGR